MGSEARSGGVAAWREASPELRELEAGKRLTDFDTYDRICKLFGWPQGPPSELLGLP
jgi:hypothetical protein